MHKPAKASPATNNIQRRSMAAVKMVPMKSSASFCRNASCVKFNETTREDSADIAASNVNTVRSKNGRSNSNANGNAVTIVPMTNDEADSSADDVSSRSNKPVLMYTDFLLLVFLGLILFLFCAAGAVAIYLIESESYNKTLLPRLNASNYSDSSFLLSSGDALPSDRKISHSFVLSIKEYFADDAFPNDAVIQLLKVALTHSGIPTERIFIMNYNSTHLNVSIASEHREYVFDIYGSFFFIFDTITTIGFGARYPRTNLGKMFTAALTMFGCPIIVLFCSVLSEKMKLTGLRIRGIFKIPSNRSRFIASNDDNGRQNYQGCENAMMTRQQQQQHQHRRSSQDSSSSSRIRLSSTSAQFCRRSCSTFVLEALGFAFFVVIPSLAFSIQEPGWTYVDSMYFAVNALSTTGFGDFMAGENLNSPVLGFYRFLYISWLLIGMTWWTVFIDATAARIRRICEKILRPLAQWLNKREEAAIAKAKANHQTNDNKKQPLLTKLSNDSQQQRQPRLLNTKLPLSPAPSTSTVATRLTPTRNNSATFVQANF